MTEFQTRKENIEKFQVVDTASSNQPDALKDGEILVKIDQFGLSANNISYALTGVQLGYWRFFPPTVGDSRWGLMPVWGFSDVIASNVEGLPVGDRLFGFYPPATHLKMTPVALTDQRMVDGAPHRDGLPAPYNIYRRVNAELGYERTTDRVRMLFWPLYMTSYMLWDFLQDKSWYEAQQVIIISASSKTSIGFAYAMQDDKAAPPSFALTSKSKLDFVTGLDLFSQSTNYEALSDIDADTPSLVIDFSGNEELLSGLFIHLGKNMIQCVKVGMTHWANAEPEIGRSADQSHFFFAPDHAQKRLKDWGPDSLSQKTATFIQSASDKSRDWLKIRTVDGLIGLTNIYHDVCHGRIAADQGLIVEL